MFRAAVVRCDEHLAQRRVAIAEILQGDRADDGFAVYRDPEVARALLVEARDVVQVRLVGARDREAELFALDRQDRRDDALDLMRSEWSDADQRPPPRGKIASAVMVMTSAD